MTTNPTDRIGQLLADRMYDQGTALYLCNQGGCDQHAESRRGHEADFSPVHDELATPACPGAGDERVSHVVHTVVGENRRQGHCSRCG